MGFCEKKEGGASRPRGGFDYFDAFSRQAAYAQEMALNLESAMGAGELGSRSLVDALHTVENDADEVNHEIQTHLIGDFYAPLERDGMVSLAHALDDVCDSIEDIAIQAYIFDCRTFGKRGLRMVALLCEACSKLKQAADDLRYYEKRHVIIRQKLVDVQGRESECDRLYLDAARSVYTTGGFDADSRRIVHALLDAVEDAMDAAENAAERMEAIMAENR